MIKTLIVDDDFLVRMYLKQVIDWEAKGYLLIGDASNGKEALTVLREKGPGLLITDLSMPVMDGISLISQARAEFPHMGIVALSCHDEFQYVKEAMKCGADEYLLKNLLDESLLCSTLDMIRHKIRQSATEEEEKETLSRLAEKGVELVRQELQETLCQQRYTVAEQRQLCLEAGIDGSFQRCAVLMMDSRDRDSTLHSVLEEYCKTRQAFWLGARAEGQCVLLDLGGIPSQAAQWEKVHSFAEGVKKCATDYLNMEAVIAVSSICAGDGSICVAFSQAAAVWSYGIYGPGIYPYSQLPGAEDLPPEVYALLNQVKGGGTAGLAEMETLTSAAFFALRTYRPSPQMLCDWYGALMEAGGIDEALPGTVEEMEQQWHRALRRQKDRNVAIGKDKHPAVRQAAAFVRKHFREPISLSQIAEEVHLNAAYLSYLFKQETGVNFSDYLTNCRMAEVKTLLRESDLSIKGCVAAAGFSDYRNFCKLFKKMVGMRPVEYRKLKNMTVSKKIP